MKLLSDLKLNRKSKVLFLLFLLVILAYIYEPNVERLGYRALLEADTLNVYHKNELVATVDQPSYMFDMFKETFVVVYKAHLHQLGIRSFSMKELYHLEFVKDGKPFVKIKVLTPRSQRGVEKIYRKGAEGLWRDLDGHLVILNESYEYFGFGENFYKHLSEALKENRKQ